MHSFPQAAKFEVSQERVHFAPLPLLTKEVRAQGCPEAVVAQRASVLQVTYLAFHGHLSKSDDLRAVGFDGEIPIHDTSVPGECAGSGFRGLGSRVWGLGLKL